MQPTRWGLLRPQWQIRRLGSFLLLRFLATPGSAVSPTPASAAALRAKPRRAFARVNDAVESRCIMASNLRGSTLTSPFL
jgi:hypothetical protein